jgi:serine/threonine protein phosphatase PrpC
MPRYETRSSQLALADGARQAASERVLAVESAALFSPEARKGRLYIVAEASGNPARADDACQLVLRTIRKHFYDDSSYSVTAALRKALLGANKALYQHNFSAPAAKRAYVGVTCAVVREQDLYLAQVAPAQAYVLAQGRPRALPAPPNWAPGQPASVVALRPRALGSSLAAEPDFFRAELAPGDGALLCTSQLAPLLDRETVARLLRAPDAETIIERVAELCRNHAVPETHALALASTPVLSRAAEAAPLSGAGVSERVRAAWQSAGAHLTRLSGEAALLLRGRAARQEQQRAERRVAQARHEQERLATAPELPTHSPHPPEPPRPLDLGEPIAERMAAARSSAARTLPPSALLGESDYAPPPERRIDLSDTPGMAALGGRRPGAYGMPPLEPTLGERLAAPFVQLAGWMDTAQRRRRDRPPPSALPPRKHQGLSYRRQKPPFPWRLLLLLTALVALLVVYGRSLAIENAQRASIDALQEAEQTVAAVRDAPDEATARERLALAADALAKVRASGIISRSAEFRQRLEMSQREFEREQLAIQKLNYFNDLVEIGRHPQAAAAATFSQIVIPPPPTTVTNTVGFESIYALDENTGVLYRMPKNGGPFQPFLSPSDNLGAGVPVGKVKAIQWRIDNVVAVAQSDNGPYLYYFRAGDQWRYSNLGGSEEWARTASKNLRLATYEGNLYLWGAAPGQLLKYFSGRPADLYDPWIKNDGGKQLDTVVDIAIDGNVYLLQPDGRVLVFELNEFKRDIPPPAVDPPLVAPTRMVVTGTPEAGSIFLVDPQNERIIQIDKQSGELIQQIRARPDGPLRLDSLRSIFVDDTSGPRPVVYLVNGGQVLRAALPERPRLFRDSGTATPTRTATP